jgi:hypothetical protein
MNSKMNSKLSDLQIEAIKNWDGEKVLSLEPNEGYTLQDFALKEEERYGATEFWCAMQKLDDLKVPRTDKEGKEYSIVGRIKRLEEIYLKKMSELETMYLSNI